MNTRMLSMLVVGLLGCGFSMAYSADPMAETEPSPTIKEQVMEDTITGTLTRKEGMLMRKEGEYYYIKDNDGMVQRIHVDKSTKSDNVITSDMVKAYVTAQGHTTTLQRDN